MTLMRRKFSPLIGLEVDAPKIVADDVRRHARPERRLKDRVDAVISRLARAFTLRRPVPPLTLDLTEWEVTFASPAEFEFALASRTEFPVHKIPPLMERSAEQLRGLATQIRHVEKRFADVLARTIEDPLAISELMRDIEVKLFTQDHEWRDIVEALNRESPSLDPYRRIALIKYMQYLASRQDILRSLYLDKSSGETEVDADGVAPHLRDTSIFEVTQVVGAAAPVAMAALPKGETVCLTLADGDEVPLDLAGAPLTLVAGEFCYLLDEAGSRHLMHRGRNFVGRHESCDVVVDSRHRAVSRRHLIVEPLSDAAVAVTDISSLGTSVPEHLL